MSTDPSDLLKSFFYNFLQTYDLKQTAANFENEALFGNQNTEPFIKANKTFLFEWWNIFFHIYSEQFISIFAQKNKGLYRPEVLNKLSMNMIFKNQFSKNDYHNSSIKPACPSYSNQSNYYDSRMAKNQYCDPSLSASHYEQGMNMNPYPQINPYSQENRNYYPGNGNMNHLNMDNNMNMSMNDMQSKKMLFATSGQCGNMSLEGNKNDYINCKRKRHIKNNKLVYVRPLSNGGKKAELDQLNEDNEEESIIDNIEPEITKADGLNIEGDNTSDDPSNSKKKKPRGSRYRGVSRNGNQWQVLIMVNKKKRYVGSYSNEEEAARAYDKVALQNHNEKAKTNFQYDEDEVKAIMHSPPLLPLK